MIKKNTSYYTEGKMGTFHMHYYIPQGLLLCRCLTIMSGFELNQIIGHQTKYRSEFENTTMS